MVTTYEDFLVMNEGLNLTDLYEKTKNLPKEAKKKFLTYGIISLLSLNQLHNIYDTVNKSNIDKESKDIIYKALDEEKHGVWKVGYDFRLSNKGWDHIKNEEKLSLVAYAIGDSKITVGWGHAEDYNTSKYKVGQKITVNEAKLLLSNDLKAAANGVRRMFKDWEDKNKKEILINQDMFDALVSMAFNMGVSGLRQSDVVSYLKSGDYINAGKTIKSTSVSARFPGLKKRRKKESEMFLSSI